ncbi:glycosyltransferase [Frisingicoccus sp.]
MKRVLMVCEAFGGGVFTYVSQLCNDMCEEFDVYLAYSLRPQTPKNYKDFLDKRVHLIQVKSFGEKGLTNIPNDIKIIKELREIEKKVKPDVIHLHSSIAGGMGRLAYNGKENTVVYTPHGYAHILMGPGKKSLMYKWMEKVLGKTNSMTLTCCESEDDVAKTLCKKTAYIETGVNLGDLSASLDGIEPVKNEKFTVFTLGRACVQKQPQLFNRIAELVPEARFVWIGNGELETMLTAQNIEITGWKPRKEALAMAKGADAFILCSLGEAIAMSLIENMYIKKLILVSNTMGNKSVIRDGINGYVCEKAEDYAEKIKAAMKKFPSELPEHAYQDVLTIYNTEAMKKKYIMFYNDVIAGKYRR